MKTLNHGFIAICLIVLGAARAYPAENQAAGAGARVHIYASPKAITVREQRFVHAAAENACWLQDPTPLASNGRDVLRLSPAQRRRGPCDES
jgi:hypothetical protein